MVDDRDENPYAADDAPGSLPLRRFPWCSTTFNVLSVCSLLAVLVMAGGLPEHPERMGIFAVKWISAPFVLAALLAAAAQVVFRVSAFAQKFYAILFVFNLLVGGFLLLAAVFGLLREIGRAFDIS